MRVTTETGATYEFYRDYLWDKTYVRRIPEPTGLKMPGDGRYLLLSEPPILWLGAPLVMYLDLTGDGNSTIRTASKVVEITND